MIVGEETFELTMFKRELEETRKELLSSSANHPELERILKRIDKSLLAIHRLLYIEKGDKSQKW